MKLRLATLVFSLLFPLAGTAQITPAQTSATPLVDRLLATDVDAVSTGTPVVPIWSGKDGELLALVALPQGWVESPAAATPAYAGPSTWRLAGSNASSSGLSLQFANGLHLDALLGQYTPTLAPCATGSCAGSQPALHWNAASGVLGMGWTSPQGALDLSYGLSWLKSPIAAPGADALLNPLPALDYGASPQWSSLMAEESSLFARGRWHFGQGPALDLTASYGRLHGAAVAGALLPSADLDQLSLSLGLDVGSLRGAIVGHVLSSDDPLLAGKRWTALDLGVSWRTPWAGVLSVGAQNILSSSPSSVRDGEGQARTPYIQYRQDL